MIFDLITFHHACLQLSLQISCTNRYCTIKLMGRSNLMGTSIGFMFNKHRIGKIGSSFPTILSEAVPPNLLWQIQLCNPFPFRVICQLILTFREFCTVFCLRFMGTVSNQIILLQYRFCDIFQQHCETSSKLCSANILCNDRISQKLKCECYTQKNSHYSSFLAYCNQL